MHPFTSTPHHYKAVAQIMVDIFDLPELLIPSLRYKTSLLSWLPLTSTHPLYGLLDAYHYLVVAFPDVSHTTLCNAWRECVRNRYDVHKEPALIWKTGRTPWQIATRHQMATLEYQHPFSWAQTVRQDLDLWCTALQLIALHHKSEPGSSSLNMASQAEKSTALFSGDHP